MYNAPSVAYPVGRCAFQRNFYTGLICVTSSVLLIWGARQAIALPWLLSLCAFFLAAFFGLQSLRRNVGVLTWDGQVWCLHDQAEGVLGNVVVSLDVQQTMILQWCPLSDTQPKRWLWLGAENAPFLWQDLRQAVFAQSSS